MIHSSSDETEHVLHTKEHQLRMFCDITCVCVLHFTESCIWVPVLLCTEEVSPFPSSVKRSSVSRKGSSNFITVETWVQYQAILCQICGGWIDTDTSTSPRNSLLPCHYHSTNDTNTFTHGSAVECV